MQHGIFREFNSGKITKVPLIRGNSEKEAWDKFHEQEIWSYYSENTTFVCQPLKDTK